MTRTDIHRPSAIVPADYGYVAMQTIKVECLGDAHFLAVQREILTAHMARTGGDFSRHYHGGSCHICGAHCIYKAVFHHAPSNVYICVGTDCADKLEWDSGEGEKFRAQVKRAADRKAGKERAAFKLADVGLDAAWAVFVSDVTSADRWEETTIRDIVGKLVQYGSISDKQTDFLRKLVAAISRRAEVGAQRAAEQEAAAPLPTFGDRVAIRGEIVSIKRADGERVFTDRMIVKHADGWKVMGSLPAAMVGAKVGDLIEFSATVKPSDRDPKFGFFSRPTKARTIAA